MFVLGSGVSRHSVGANGDRPPVWKEFLAQAIADCPDKSNMSAIQSAFDSGDFLHACEWLKKRYDEGWIAYLRRRFSSPAFAPAVIHNIIVKFDSRIVLSLNFDDIYERCANGLHNGAYVTKNYYDEDVAEFLRGDGRYIVKVHGSLNSPARMIFTQRDYSDARVKHSAFYEAFDAALLTHTFVFVGSGYSDPDVNLLLENQKFGFPTQAPHYFLTAEGFESDRIVSLRDNRNLKVLQYDPIDAIHSGLVSELRALQQAVDAHRQQIALRAEW